jgi:hypothetical protein
MVPPSSEINPQNAVKDLGLAACTDTIVVEIQLKKLTTCSGMPPIAAGNEPGGAISASLRGDSGGHPR